MRRLALLSLLLGLFAIGAVNAAPVAKSRSKTTEPDYHQLPLLKQRFSVTTRLSAQQLATEIEKSFVRLMLAGDRSNQPITLHAKDMMIAELMDALAAHFGAQWYCVYSNMWVLASSQEEASSYWKEHNASTGALSRDYMNIRSQRCLDELVGSLSSDQWDLLKKGGTVPAIGLKPTQRSKVKEAFLLLKRSEIGVGPNTPADEVLLSGNVQLRLRKLGQQSEVVVDYPKKARSSSAEDITVPLKLEKDGAFVPERELERDPPELAGSTVNPVVSEELDVKFTLALQTPQNEQLERVLGTLGAKTGSSFLMGGDWIDQPLPASGPTALGVMRMLAERSASAWKKAGDNTLVLVPVERKKMNAGVR